LTKLDDQTRQRTSLDTVKLINYCTLVLHVHMCTFSARVISLWLQPLQSEAGMYHKENATCEFVFPA